MVSNNGSDKIYDFGPYRVDSGQRFLLRNQKPIHLSPKTFELLIFLIEHPNQVIDKERVMEEVWKDLYVEEANIAVHISTLRKALNGDGQNGATIETFPKVGYRFSADVREVPNGALPTAGGTNAAIAGSRSRNIRIAAVVLGTAVVLISGYLIIKWFNGGAPNTQTMERIQGTEQSSEMAISPNGEYLAHTISKAGKFSLMMTNIGSNSSTLATVAGMTKPSTTVMTTATAISLS